MFAAPLLTVTVGGNISNVEDTTWEFHIRCLGRRPFAEARPRLSGQEVGCEVGLGKLAADAREGNGASSEASGRTR